jgi:hypothetical protein
MKKTIKAGMVAGVFLGVLMSINEENFLISITMLISILLFVKFEPYIDKLNLKIKKKK